MIQFDGQPWAPTSCTKPLGGELQLSDGPRLAELLHQHYRLPDGQLIELDEWQQATLNHALERFPLDWPDQRLAGRLRYRQLVVSLGRQNGKSILGAAFGLYGLVQHVSAPSVIGVATSVEQANVVYRRVQFAVSHDELLLELLRPSGTRGIAWRDGRGGYAVKPNLAEGLQSVPVTCGVADELHLMPRMMWDSIVNGQRAQPDGILAGITTAGDEGSTLLIDLYQRGLNACADPTSDLRFGFFLWTSPEGSTIDTPGAIEAANPAVACGRINVEDVRVDVRALPVPDQERYTLNRFVAASQMWADMAQWDACATTTQDESPLYVFGVARTPGWDFVTIAAAVKHPDGTIAVETIASLRRWDRDRVLELCLDLNREHHGSIFAMQSRSLSSLGKLLRAEDVEVHLLTQTEEAEAATGIWSRVVLGTLQHDAAAPTRHQLPRTRQNRHKDGSWTIAPPEGGHADAVHATWAAAHVADVAWPADDSGIHI